MLSTHKEHPGPFMVGDVGHQGAFVHVFTDLSLRLVLREFDTITDLVRYLANRAVFLRQSYLTVAVRGEEELIPLYFRGYDQTIQSYDIMRGLRHDDDGEKPNMLLVDGGFYDDMIKRPEYQARRHENEISYLWDALIEQFARHQIDGTSTLQRPAEYEGHEGGIRFMALEPRLARRGLAGQLKDAIESFPDARDLAARTILPGDPSDDIGYLFMQVRPPISGSYDQYRRARAHLLRVYVLALMHDQPFLKRVVGVALEPPRLYKDQLTSEDIILAERDQLSPEELSAAKAEKMGYGLNTISSIGRSRIHEFPNIET
jgi:hypothetical protein